VKVSTRLFAIAAVLVACVVAWSGMNSPAQEKAKGAGRAPAPVPKWEYKLTTLSELDENAEQELKKLGEEGWELVGSPSVVSARPQAQGSAGTSTKVKLIFKRTSR
jgi:hypothetical protein